MRKMNMLILSGVIGMAVFGCSSKEKAMSDEEVLEMIEIHAEDYYSSCNFDGWDVILDKRQIDIENKVDYVWASATASSDLLYLDLDYCATFVQYNDGWHMENIEVEDYDYSILRSTITEEDAREYVEEETEYDEFWFVDNETNLDSGRDYYTYQGTRYSEYLGREVTDTIEVRFEFGIYDGWFYLETKYDKEDTPDFSPWESGYTIAPTFG